MTTDLLSQLSSQGVDSSGPVALYAMPAEGRSIHWLGIEEETVFRCNTYLILDGDQSILVDPGNRHFFPQVRDRVAELISPERISGIILCHQDPDVAASLPDWLKVNPDIIVFSSPRTKVLLPHYGVGEFRFHDVEDEPTVNLPSGNRLRFIPAPFLHSPMAFATLDEQSGLLFTGDIFAAIDTEWRLVVEEFEAHRVKLDYFHIDYMAANAAATGFVNRLQGIDVKGLLPQHGSLIPERFVDDALEYLLGLRCGLDLIYPDLMP